VLRRHVELVIETLMDNAGKGLKSIPFSLCFSGVERGLTLHTVLEFVKPPDLNQARVNKCLIALVNRKIVRKENSTVRTRPFANLCRLLTYYCRAQSYTIGRAFLHDRLGLFDKCCLYFYTL
jgi:hypothetical protein